MAVAQSVELPIEMPTRGPWHWPKGTTNHSKMSVPALLWALHDLGGTVEDKTGRAASRLVEHATELGTPIHPLSNPGHLFKELEGGRYAGAIKRKVGPKRTYAIRLLLEERQMPPKPRPAKAEPAEPKTPALALPVVKDEPKAEVETISIAPGLPVVPPEPSPAPVEPILPPIVAVPASDPLNALLEIQGLAMQAVLGLAEQMGQGIDLADAAERDAEKTRLAETIEENRRLRRKVNDLTETLVAKGKEVEAMRKALNIAQSNMAAIQKAAADAPNRERQYGNLKATERFMQARPVAK
jgi:hypothetical protein